MTEANLGCATTEELMNELIARFGVNALIDEFESSLNYLRAKTMRNILIGMNSTTKEYRTVGDAE